jgi:hypothetical protein
MKAFALSVVAAAIVSYCSALPAPQPDAKNPMASADTLRRRDTTEIAACVGSGFTGGTACNIIVR